MEVLIVTLLALSLSDERALGAQLGKCHTRHNEYSLCEETPIVRGYIRTAHPVGENMYFTVLTEHYSHFDGEPDIVGDESRQTSYQNGTFAGIEYRF